LSFPLLILAANQKSAIHSAVEVYTKKIPCITFKETPSATRDSPFPYVSFELSPNAFGEAALGVHGYNSDLNRHPVNLCAGCFTPYVVLHELGHILGLSHEQQRFDRDKYVTVSSLTGTTELKDRA